jgi:hypothetical protein
VRRAPDLLKRTVLLLVARLSAQVRRESNPHETNHRAQVSIISCGFSQAREHLLNKAPGPR